MNEIVKYGKEVKGPSWKLNYLQFTKEDAKKALMMFREDRKTKQEVVNAYARTMNAGYWDPYRVSQIPIAFDREGYRLNGKHRLLAFEQSKLHELIFPVAYNVPSEEHRAFDQNILARQHKTAHPDRTNVNRDEARLNWLEMLITGEPKIKITTDFFDYLVDGKWKRQIIWAGEMFPLGARVGKAPYVMCFMYIHRIDPPFAEKIGQAWYSGEAGLPVQLVRMRDAAISGQDNNTRDTTGKRMGRFRLVLKMLNALAYLHRGENLPTRLPDNLNGLRYFSEKLRDGAATKWQKKIYENNEE